MHWLGLRVSVQLQLRLNFEPLLRLSRGEKQGTARARAQIMANSYEAVIGALYLDQGYDATKKFIENSLLVTFDEILKEWFMDGSKITSSRIGSE